MAEYHEGQNTGVDDGDGGSVGSSSFLRTCFNTLNALSGVGILSVSYTLASGGWLSLSLLLVIAAITFYTSLLIKECMKSDPSIKTYPDIGERAFGSRGRVIVSIFMNLELYLVATGFLILEGDNLNNLFPDLNLEMVGLRLNGKQAFTMTVALIILPTVWWDNLDVLSYISLSGVLASTIILGSISWLGAFDGVGFHHKGMLIKWDGVPTAVSLYAFCYGAHTIMPTLYTSMKSKHQFTHVLLLCFLLCTIGYGSMAVLGYLMYGSQAKSQITLNLPVYKASSKVAIYTTLVNPIAKYALLVTPVISTIKGWFPVRFNKKPFSLLISTMLVLSSIIVALTVPFFGYLMSMVGALLNVSCSILLPCLCYLKISGNYKKLGFETTFLLVIIGFCVPLAIAGTYTAIREIIENL